jgi:serine-type D-Ala-D-Ala carboxypeptidase
LDKSGVGAKGKSMKQADCLMQAGVRDKIFPGGVLLASKAGRVVFFKAYGYADIFSKRKMTENTLFDLASLTKPLAVTPAVIRLVQEGRIQLDQEISEIIPEFGATDKKMITVRQLLSHTSGLPDYVPYYKEVGDGPFVQRQNVLRQLLLQTPLKNPIGETMVYSDVGFMILNWLVERLVHMRLNTYVRQVVYAPLNLDVENGLFFVDLNQEPPMKNFAATEYCPWRKRLLCGMVHDENAYAAGGVEGHAGLFGNAGMIHCLLSAFLSIYHQDDKPEMFCRDLLRLFLARHDRTERALGFDTPSEKNSSAGEYFSKESVGHLGFTGTSFWMDLKRCLIVILLTNRIHPTRKNEQIRQFRPMLHNAVMASLIKAF